MAKVMLPAGWLDCDRESNKDDKRCMEFAEEPLCGVLRPACPRLSSGLLSSARKSVVFAGAEQLIEFDLSSYEPAVASGEYADPARGTTTRGTGSPFDTSTSGDRMGLVELSPEQWVVLDGKKFVRVDPATGDRTVAHTVADLSCGGRAVTYLSASTLTVSANGQLFVFGALGPVEEHDYHIFQLSASDWVCRIVTSLSDPAQGPTELGGVALAISERGDALWALSNSGDPSLLRVQVSDGTRLRVSGSTVGTGGSKVGLEAILVRPDRIWTLDYATIGVTLTSINPDNGDRLAHSVGGPLRDIRSTNAMRLLPLPDSNIMLVSTGYGLFLYDSLSGMSNTAAIWMQDLR